MGIMRLVCPQNGGNTYRKRVSILRVEMGILGTYLWAFWGHTYRKRVSILRVEMGILGTYL